jgi:hypothetical protein
LLFGSPVPPAERSKTNPFEAIRQAIDAETPPTTTRSLGGFTELPNQFPAPATKVQTRGTTVGNISSGQFTETSTPGQKTPPTDKARQLDFWFRLTVQADQVIAKLQNLGRNDLAAPLINCHTEKTIALCKSCRKPQAFFNRCEVFYCPTCQPRLARDKRKRIEPLALAIRRPRHVILTVKNIPHLTHAKVQWFKDCFKKLRNSRWATETTQLGHIDPADPLAGKVVTSHPWKGGIYSLEVTNEGKGAHLHMHILLDAHFVDQLALSEEWRRITENHGHIVKVLSCGDIDYLHEIGKYIVKGSDLATWTDKELVNFIDAFKDVRTWGTWGSTFALKKQFAEASRNHDNQSLKCTCGCEDFFYLSQSEWDWYETSGFLPPPKWRKN